MILRAVIWHHLIPGSRRGRAFAYLSDVWFPKGRDGEKTSSTLGVATEKRSVIHRADGVSLGIEAAWRQSVDLGNQTRWLSSPRRQVWSGSHFILAAKKIFE